jgi:hypothetical protein
MDGQNMTVMECARRIMQNDWTGVKEIDVSTLGLALIMVEVFQKNHK